MQSENGVFAFIPEPQPSLGEAKVCKARGMQSENGVFAFIPEPQPGLGGAKVCKARLMDFKTGGPEGVEPLYNRR